MLKGEIANPIFCRKKRSGESLNPAGAHSHSCNTSGYCTVIGTELMSPCTTRYHAANVQPTVSP